MFEHLDLPTKSNISRYKKEFSSKTPNELAAEMAKWSPWTAQHVAAAYWSQQWEKRQWWKKFVQKIVVGVIVGLLLVVGKDFVGALTARDEARGNDAKNLQQPKPDAGLARQEHS